MSKFKKIVLTKFKAITLTAVIGLGSTADALAQSYTIQIGAYKYLSQRILNQAERYGQVFQSQASSNLTRVQVGSFENRSEATSLLKQLRSAGYRDAFITQLAYTPQSTASPSATSSLQSTDYTTQNNAIVQYAPSSLSNQEITFDSLTEEEKTKATFLDDKLYIYENGEFITVPQYRSAR